MKLMKRAIGMSFNVCRLNNRWHFSLNKLENGTMRPRINGQDCEFGLRFDFVLGTIRRPIAKWYDWHFWDFSDRYHRNLVNPWNSGNHWFVLTIPYIILPFVSVTLGRYKFGVPGFYIGGRTSDLSNRIDWQLRIDWNKDQNDITAWAWDTYGNPIHAWGSISDEGASYIEPTLTFRSDMMH